MSFANSQEIFRGGQNHLFQKIGKIHQYSYFGTIYSKKKGTKIYQWNYKESIGNYYFNYYFYKNFQKIKFFTFLLRLQRVKLCGVARFTYFVLYFTMPPTH
jgi:hypothetical protein